MTDFQKYLERESYDEATLVDWYISSVNAQDTPVWTIEHIEELVQDFYIIPRNVELKPIYKIEPLYKDIPKLTPEMVADMQRLNQKIFDFCGIPRELLEDLDESKLL